MDNFSMDAYNDIMALRRRSNVITAENALIEEISSDGGTGFVTISYGVMDDNCMVHVNVVRLVVNRNTVIRDRFGQPLNFRDLREGMIVDAEFSTAMTRSVPPQSNAFRITVIKNNDNANMRVDSVIGVDPNFNFLYTGNPDDIYSQMRFVVTDSTIITDRRGRQIGLTDIRPGDTVRVEHANFQTASIPPQTTAFRIEVL